MTADTPRARKGEQTRAAILAAALSLSARDGLDAITIGLLAELTQMSKSGVFAHFGSREELQIAVVQVYHDQFEQSVFLPALQQAPGLPRLRTMIGNWARRGTSEIDQEGCLYIGGAFEYAGRPGPVRDALARSIGTWRDALVRAADQARTLGQLTPDTDTEQLVFELTGLVLALHHDVRFLRRPDAVARVERSVDRLLARHAHAVAA